MNILKASESFNWATAEITPVNKSPFPKLWTVIVSAKAAFAKKNIDIKSRAGKKSCFLFVPIIIPKLLSKKFLFLLS